MSKKTPHDTADQPEDQATPQPEAAAAERDPPGVEAAGCHEAAVDQALADENAPEDAPAAAEPETAPEEPSVDDLRRQCEETTDRALRLGAELENYRKRVAREMDEQRRYANLPLLRDLLPVWDNMGRAIEAAEKNHQVTSLLEGFKMVARQLEDVMGRHQCKQIEALGQPFDPHRHEAVSQQPSPDHPPNTVIQVVQAGFQLHDRVVRPSQVVVSTSPPPADQEPEAPSDEADSQANTAPEPSDKT